MWSRDYEKAGERDSRAVRVTVTPSGEIIVAGTHRRGTLSGNFPLIARFDADGQMLSETNDLSRDLQITDIDADSNGNLVAVATDVGAFDGWIGQLDAMGMTLWSVLWEDPGGAVNSMGLAVDVDGADNATLGGGWAMSRVGLAQYDSSGTERWFNEPLDGVPITEIRALETFDASGDVSALGGTSAKKWLARYSSTGALDWQSDVMDTRSTSTYLPENHDRYTNLGGLAVDGDGNSYVSGCPSADGETSDATVVKVDETGQPVWTITYDSDHGLDDCAHDVVVTPDGGIVMAGVSRHTEGNSVELRFEAFVAKFGP